MRNTILAAKEMGKEVHLYTSSGEGFLSGISGIHYHSNYYFRSRFRILTLFTFFISQLVLAFRLLKYWRNSNVFYINTILPFSAIWMGKLLGKKVFVHVHEFEISPKLLSDFLFLTVRLCADEIIVVSKFLAQNPALVPRKSRVIYNCVKKEIEDQAFTKEEVHDDFRVLMLASLRPYKGIYEFLQLASELPGIGFDLILSDSEEEVDRWKSSQKVPENLTIYPVQQDVIPFFKNSSLVLNLAHKDKWLETFGMTILEGMNFGLPAIVPTVGGVTELVKDGVNGFLVDYSDISTIKVLIEKLQSDIPFWRKLSLNALERSALFSTKIFSQEIQILLK
nr:glycosyltransferase family 4 protein [Algoriphagus sp. A40]